MERYKMIKEVGNGTFGSVWRALNKQTSELVAIKKMKKKYYSWDECINLREVKSLRKMNHPNIVRLKEVLRENDTLCFVFEYMECNLYQLMKDRVKPFSEAEVKNWCFQIFQGLAYMHQRGYFHRDLKPENLLVSKNIIKIADFGLAREINTKPPYTEYVSTRWYRAPEVLLQSPTYGPAVDMWAMGAIMAELFTLRALFPGSSEADEILKICSVIGTPTESQWAEGLELARLMNYQFPQSAGGPLSMLISSASRDAVDLLASLCSWDPCKRPTALEALQHPFFKSCNLPCLRPKSSLSKTPPSVGTKVPLERKLARRLSGTLPDLKPTNQYTKPHASSHASIQRRLEMTSQEQKHHKATLKQPLRFQPPPANNGPIANYKGKTRGICATTEKLGKMTISSDEVLKKEQQQPSRMKKAAGVWHSKPPDACFGRSRESLPARTTITRKVTG